MAGGLWGLLGGLAGGGAALGQSLERDKAQKQREFENQLQMQQFQRQQQLAENQFEFQKAQTARQNRLDQNTEDIGAYKTALPAISSQLPGDPGQAGTPIADSVAKRLQGLGYGLQGGTSTVSPLPPQSIQPVKLPGAIGSLPPPGPEPVMPPPAEGEGDIPKAPSLPPSTDTINLPTTPGLGKLTSTPFTRPPAEADIKSHIDQFKAIQTQTRSDADQKESDAILSSGKPFEQYTPHEREVVLSANPHMAPLVAAPPAPVSESKFVTDPGGKPLDKDTKGAYYLAGTKNPYTGNVKVAPAASQQPIIFTDSGKNVAADVYQSGGGLPILRAGPAGQAVANVINEVGARRDAANASGSGVSTDVSANKAVLGANTQALNKLTTTVANITGFENAAQANVRQFTDMMAKLTDSGSPIINAPIRSLQANVFGDPNVPAAMAARDVALREISRITNNPNLTGVLHAQELAKTRGLIKPGATLGQVHEALNILLTDMANVKAGMEGEKRDIEGQIRGRNNPTPAPQAAPPPSTEPDYIVVGGKVVPNPKKLQ